MTIIVGNLIDTHNISCAQGTEKSIDWTIETSKEAFYPGEPVLLTLNIRNNGNQEQEIDFGGGGITAFSMEILDSNHTVITKGEKLERSGVSRFITVKVAPGEIGTRSVVLNRWCSTLLPPGPYHVICNVDYRLVSELELSYKKRVPAPQHNVRLELDFKITELNTSEFKKIVDELAKRAFTTADRSAQGRVDRQIAENSLAFTESLLVVPHQLRILRNGQYSWLRRDLIDSLIWSETLEAATGLVKIIEDPSVYIGDVRREAIDAVYRLRETGKPEIINATNEFVSKHKRPVLATSVIETRRIREKPMAVTTKPIIERTPLWNWLSFVVGMVVGMSIVFFILLLKKKPISRSK
jgi:hypothetical protein